MFEIFAPDFKVLAIRAIQLLVSCGCFTHASLASAYFQGRLLDRTFGTQGEIAIEVSGSRFYVDSMLVTRDGSLVVVYSTTVASNGGPSVTYMARFRHDGSPDPAFGASNR